jgi:hypothetical protein
MNEARPADVRGLVKRYGRLTADDRVDLSVERGDSRNCNAWHGPFMTPTDWGLIGHAVWVSVLYAVPPLVGAWILFRRRDVAT